jgi:hypothetical protein
MTWRPHLALNGALKLKANFHIAPHPLPSRQKTRAMAQMPVGKCSGKHSRQLPANNWKPVRKPIRKPVHGLRSGFLDTRTNERPGIAG